MGIVRVLAVVAAIIVNLMKYAQELADKRKKEEYQKDVESIEENPLDYANERYGSKLPNSATEKRDLSGDNAK